MEEQGRKACLRRRHLSETRIMQRGRHAGLREGAKRLGVGGGQCKGPEANARPVAVGRSPQR